MRAIDTTKCQSSVSLIVKVEGEDGLLASIHQIFHWSSMRQCAWRCLTCWTGWRHSEEHTIHVHNPTNVCFVMFLRSFRLPHPFLEKYTPSFSENFCA